MKLDALEHPKTYDFAARLGVSRPTALGHLELLWAFVGKQAPQGNVGKWPDGAIARACDWMGDPQCFLQSLLQSGFIDSHPEHRYVIHDWHEHAPRWVRAKLAKLNLAFIISTERTVVATTDRTSSDDDDDPDDDVGSTESTVVRSVEASSKGREEKSKEGKGRRGASKNRAARSTTDDFDPSSVSGLDQQAWALWIEHRSAIRKPIRPHSLQDAAEELAKLGDRQMAEVKRARAGGWQGLHPERANGAGTGTTAPATRYRTADEIEAEERARGDADAQH